MKESDLWVISEMEVTRLGISMTLKGYYYLIIAVVLSVKLGIRQESLCKVLYQKIADMHQVSWCSVEKDIRNCLFKAWSEGSGALRSAYPRNSKKPTNGEVIAYITSRIRLETPLRI